MSKLMEDKLPSPGGRGVGGEGGWDLPHPPNPLLPPGEGGVYHALCRLRLSLHFTKTNLLAAMEYRVTFVLQVLGMFVNDAAFTVLWYIFFQSFPTVNG